MKPSGFLIEKSRFVPVLLTAVMILAGCATLKTDIDQPGYPAALPSDEDIVAGFTMDPGSAVAPLFISAVQPAATRSFDVSKRIDGVVAALSYDNESVSGTGIVTGTFPIGAIRWNLAGDERWIRKRGAVPYHVHPESGLELCVVSRSMLIISTGGMDKALSRMTGDSEKGAPPVADELWRKLETHEAYLYTESPEALLSRFLPVGDTKYPLSEFVALLNTKDGEVVLSGWLTVETERQARAFAVVLRLLLISQARESGNEEMSSLIRSAVIEPSGTKVTFEGVTLTPAHIDALLGAAASQRGEQ